jgi:superfamily I DNA and/or RNA helicase
MIWKIVHSLTQQGYSTDNLVILTPYLGQLSKLRDVLKDNDLDSHDLIRAGLLTPDNNTSKKRIRLAAIGMHRSLNLNLSLTAHVVRIDNYQGEESGVVIASLTRSNTSIDIGFMNSPVRLNVFVSRARGRFILIGNSQTFMNAQKGKEFWGTFFHLVNQGGYMYEGFPIKFERYPDRKVLIKFAPEFDVVCPDGGCTELW